MDEQLKIHLKSPHPSPLPEGEGVDVSLPAHLSICVPITHQIKGYPFEVLLAGEGATGVALADQVKSLDWKTRQAERKGKATPAEIAQIKAKIKSLLSL